MKYLIKTTFAVMLFSLFSLTAFADTLSFEETKELSTKIEKYVNTLDQAEKDGSATIYTHFLIKDEGYIYTVDFMVSSLGEITILSMDIEEEFYKVDLFNATQVKKYTVAMPIIAD